MDRNVAVREAMKDFIRAVLSECRLMHDSRQVDFTRWMLRVEIRNDERENSGYFIIDQNGKELPGSFVLVRELGYEFSEQAIESAVDANLRMMLALHGEVLDLCSAAEDDADSGVVPTLRYTPVRPAAKRVQPPVPESRPVTDPLPSGQNPARAAAIHAQHTRPMPAKAGEKVQAASRPSTVQPAPSARPKTSPAATVSRNTEPAARKGARPSASQDAEWVPPSQRRPRSEVEAIKPNPGNQDFEMG